MTDLKNTGRSWNIISETGEIVENLTEFEGILDETEALNYPGLVAGHKGWALVSDKDTSCDNLMPFCAEPDADMIGEQLSVGLAALLAGDA